MGYPSPVVWVLWDNGNGNLVMDMNFHKTTQEHSYQIENKF